MGHERAAGERQDGQRARGRVRFCDRRVAGEYPQAGRQRDDRAGGAVMATLATDPQAVVPPVILKQPSRPASRPGPHLASSSVFIGDLPAVFEPPVRCLVLGMVASILLAACGGAGPSSTSATSVTVRTATSATAAVTTATTPATNTTAAAAAPTASAATS